MALAVLTACSGDSPAGTGDPVATALTLSEQQITHTALDQVHLLTASVKDQHGSVMASAPIAWSSSNADVAPVSSIGVVTAVANGSATITATSGSASAAAMVTVHQVGVSIESDPPYLELDEVGDAANDDGSGAGPGGSAPSSISLAVFVGPRVLTITGTQPSPIAEGTAAVIEGVGFSPVAADNVVTLGGLAVQVTAASPTSLDVAVPVPCQPLRQDELSVDVLGLTATSTATVVPANPLDLEVGEGAFASDGCLPLLAGSGGEQYLVGALSTSEQFDGLAAVRIESAVSEAPVVSPPMVAGTVRRTFSVPVEPSAVPAIRTGDASRTMLAREPFPDHSSREAEIRTHGPGARRDARARRLTAGRGSAAQQRDGAARCDAIGG